MWVNPQPKSHARGVGFGLINDLSTERLTVFMNGSRTVSSANPANCVNQPMIEYYRYAKQAFIHTNVSNTGILYHKSVCKALVLTMHSRETINVSRETKHVSWDGGNTLLTGTVRKHIQTVLCTLYCMHVTWYTGIPTLLSCQTNRSEAG